VRDSKKEFPVVQWLYFPITMIVVTLIITSVIFRFIHFVLFAGLIVIAIIYAIKKIRKSKNLKREFHKVSTLEERILHDIKDLFVYIRHYAFSKDETALKNALIQIEEKRALVNHFATTFEKEIFNYCFDNIKNLFEERQYEILYDFADAVHNLPEIFYCKYNLNHYWETYIEPLRKKHGKQFFNDYQHLFDVMNTNLLKQNK